MPNSAPLYHGTLQGYHFGFSWLDFRTAPTLDDVDIHLSEVNFPRQTGTKIFVSELKECEIWRGQNAIKRLESELSRMISPYRQICDFTVLVIVDGKELELLEVSDHIRNIAPVRYKISFDGTKISIKGCARLDHFKPSNSNEADNFALLVESDSGKDFFNFMRSQKTAQLIGLTRSQATNWFVEFQWVRVLEDIDKVQRNNDGNIANPGPFNGK